MELLKDARFRFTPVLDVNLEPWAWAYSRLQVRLAREWHQRTGRETAWQLGYTTRALLRAARQRQADLFIAHSEPALFALAQLKQPGARSAEPRVAPEAPRSTLHAPHFRVGVDMEDWFSEDLLPEYRKGRPIQLLRSLERGVLSQASHSTCTSRAMSEALAKEYGCRPPTVIYNAFPWADRQKLDGEFKDRKDRSVPSLHWYSQTLGRGRGLEELFAALPHAKVKFEIHLRGNPIAGFHTWLREQLPEKWRASVFIHDLVSNDELLSRIAEHDIGFAGEQTYCRSRDLTVTNKLLHYLLAGLPVVASETAGQREVAAQANGAVRIYPSDDSLALATQLNVLLASAEELQSAKAAALEAAEKTFCWEHQVPVLLSSIKRSLP